MTAAAAALAGCGILITRPAHQAGPLAALIHAAGGRPVIFPALEILDPPDPQPLLDAIARLESYDLAVFISPNAVTRVMERMAGRRAWPAGLRVAAIGKGGVSELERHGIHGVIVPQRGFDSERLLEMPQLQAVSGKRVLILRGDGGRELLGDTLAARGAQVDYVACYRRALPQTDPAPLLQAWAQDGVHATVVTSSEGLRNLFVMLGKPGEPLLQHTPLLVPHPRIAAVARELGCRHVIETAAGDDGLMAGLLRQFSAK
jgi:uroporphyrinogen-III synthase